MDSQFGKALIQGAFAAGLRQVSSAKFAAFLGSQDSVSLRLCGRFFPQVTHITAPSDATHGCLGRENPIVEITKRAVVPQARGEEKRK